jgi:hypothetical protein
MLTTAPAAAAAAITRMMPSSPIPNSLIMKTLKLG